LVKCGGCQLFSANVHSRLLEALAQASPTPAEELVREHLNPWIVALSAAAVKESTEPEAVSFTRGKSKSLKPAEPVSIVGEWQSPRQLPETSRSYVESRSAESRARDRWTRRKAAGRITG
jgi:hypothetical protein